MKQRTYILGSFSILVAVAVIATSAPPSQGQASAQVARIIGDARTPIPSLPFRISKSGSYFLARSLVGAQGTDGITVDADNVTLDLNGFTLRGMAGSGNAIIAVKAFGYRAFLTRASPTIPQQATAVAKGP